MARLAWVRTKSRSPETSVTVSLFSVMVPVLSVARISMPPKSSMADRRLTTTLCLARRRAPRDKQKVITRGSASGIAAVAKAMEKIIMSAMLVSPPFIIKLVKKTTKRVMLTNLRTKVENLFMPFSKLLVRWVSTVSLAMEPM